MRTEGQTDGRTERRDEANIRFTQFCTFSLRIFKEDERGGAREMHTKFWYGNPKERQFGRPRLRWRITLN